MKDALIFWFTGLSGSGKTTIASAAKTLLEEDGYSVLILDGDDVRNRLHIYLGFSREDIIKNNSQIVDLCLKYRKNYEIIISDNDSKDNTLKAVDAIQTKYHKVIKNNSII